MTPDTVATLLLAGSRFVAYALALGVVGVVAFRLVMVRTLRSPDVAVGRAGLASAAWRWGMMLAVGLAMAHVARLYAQTYSIFGIDEPVGWSHLGIVLFQTPWGSSWAAQVLAVGVAGLSFGWVAIDEPVGWTASVAAILGVVATAPATGHAAAHPGGLAMTLQAVHIVAIGAWIGGLGVLLALGVRGSGRRFGDRAGTAVAQMVNAFSPLALAAASVVVGSGLWTSVLYFSAWNQLWTEPYGRTLAAKVVVVGGVAALGAYNWRRVRPALGGDAGSDRLARSGVTELVVASVVLALTAFLTGMASPGE